MAPTSSTEPAPAAKHIMLHQFMKRQLLPHRLKPAMMWSWATTAATGRPADDDVLGGAWPPRSYTCAFCRREFKSAQALGGHMNVHRRDRAKMRGLHGAAGQKLVGAAPAAGQGMPHDAAPAEYAVLYPILNSNAAGEMLIPSGDVLLSSTPLALAPAHDQCHVSDDEDEEVDLELRLWWP